LLLRQDLEFAVPALCVGESAELLGARSGWKNEALFLRAVAELPVYLPLDSDWGLIADEVERYAQFDIGATDASVIVLARRLQADTVATLDHRHFRAIRPGHVPAFTLLP
jgi:predicted nucleic acid-binding protein